VKVRNMAISFNSNG